MRFEPVDICFPFMGDEVGGSHISAIKLIQGLNDNGIRTVIALHDIRGKLASFLDKAGLAFEQAPVSEYFRSGRASNRLRAAGRLAGQTALSIVPLTRFLTSFGTKIVHTNDGCIHLTWTLPARLAGAKHVWHHRGDPDANGVNILGGLLASHIITVSEFARPNRSIVSINDKLSVIYSPFESSSDNSRRGEFRRELIDRLGCDPSTGLLGYFGLLIERKRPLEFVDAVAAYAKAHPTNAVMGLLFGSVGQESLDMDRRVMRRAAELGIADRIRLMGFQTPVDPWLSAVDVLLVPAVREPFGRTLIEAMFLGTPVIAVDDGGNSEAIDHGRTGILVPPGTPTAFVSPIHRLLTDSSFRDEITHNARRNAVASYGTATHVSRVLEIYRSLLSSKSWTPAVQPIGEGQ